MTNPSRGELVPGGLAMVIGYRTVGKHVGKLVTTERPALDGETSPSGLPFSNLGLEDVWLCRAGSLYSVLQDGARGADGYAYIEARYLKPINPEPDPLKIEEQQEQSV